MFYPVGYTKCRFAVGMSKPIPYGADCFCSVHQHTAKFQFAGRDAFAACMDGTALLLHDSGIIYKIVRILLTNPIIPFIMYSDYQKPATEYF